MLKGHYSHFPDWAYSRVKPLGRKALSEAEAFFLRVELEFSVTENKSDWIADVARSLEPYRDRSWLPVALGILAQKYKVKISDLKKLMAGGQ